jgi:hypothetical protein
MIIFAGSIERENTVTVDGYSDRKTISGAVKDFGRYIEKKYHNGEGQCIINIVKDGISETNNPFVSPKDSCGGYFFEIEEVPCASRYDEETDEMEYKEANYYLCMRFVK